ncbi:MAG: prepilin-type N-terminal cleavage/methylation domain-containing protein, partial [Deltaproteobacteria bacterium]|nr:prepilin-type N-terminal cleavage/methylation domain-containing protein [Deltaproteobacteria bacterium]
MKMRLDLSTKKEAPTKIHLGRFPLNPARCTLHPEKGFTLLELLVSIAILSMVLVMIYGTLSMGSRAWEKGEEDIEKVQRMRVVMNLLSREIKSTFPYKITPSELDTHKEFYAFEGKKDSVSFVSTIPLKGGRRGLSWLSFWVESEEGLVVVERDALRSDIFKERDSIDKDEIEVLDSNVTSMELEYYELKSGK